MKVQDLVACEVSELAAGKEFLPHLTTNRQAAGLRGRRLKGRTQHLGTLCAFNLSRKLFGSVNACTLVECSHLLSLSYM